MDERQLTLELTVLIEVLPTDDPHALTELVARSVKDELGDGPFQRQGVVHARKIHAYPIQLVAEITQPHGVVNHHDLRLDG